MRQRDQGRGRRDRRPGQVGEEEQRDRAGDDHLEGALTGGEVTAHEQSERHRGGDEQGATQHLPQRIAAARIVLHPCGEAGVVEQAEQADEGKAHGHAGQGRQVEAQPPAQRQAARTEQHADAHQQGLVDDQFGHAGHDGAAVAFARVEQRPLHQRDRSRLRRAHEGGLAHCGLPREGGECLGHAAQHPTGAAEVGAIAHQHQVAGAAAQDVALEVGRDQQDAFGLAVFQRLARQRHGRWLGHDAHGMQRIHPAQEFAAGAAVVVVDHHDGQVAGHLMAVGGRVEERVEHHRPDHQHHRVAIGEHRAQGLAQTAAEATHTPLPGAEGGAAAVTRAAAIRRQPPMPPATSTISTSVASGHSEMLHGAPTNCCWVCSLT
ncbi:hypothetical protein D3C71_1155120 [compost metagenome]